MADYWKSNPRKFCEFCKCWTIDNKASRDFHERGKRHQENVRLKISQLKKKGVDDARKEEEASKLMKDIEKAAISQFRKDMQQNPDLASQYGINLNNKQISFDMKPNVDSSDTGDSAIHEGDWEEVVMEDGKVYYWNSITNVSVWELPSGPTQTSAEVKVKSASIKRKSEKPSTIKTEIKEESIDKKPDLKNIRNVKHEINTWNSVEIKNHLNVSNDSASGGHNFLELPVDTLSHAVSYAADRNQFDDDDVVKLEFKEKSVPTKASSAPVVFKKRKINRNNQASETS